MDRANEFSKKGWLDYIYFVLGKQQFDFYVSGTFIIDGVKNFRKWRKYSEVIMTIGDEDEKIEWINQRQILPNEIVLDIEDPEEIKKVRRRLKYYKWKNYTIYKTGSRGYHVHIFTRGIMTEQQKLSIIKKFGADEQKCYNKNLIALENCPHWKTGNIKEEIK